MDDEELNEDVTHSSTECDGDQQFTCNNDGNSSQEHTLAVDDIAFDSKVVLPPEYDDFLHKPPSNAGLDTISTSLEKHNFDVSGFGCEAQIVEDDEVVRETDINLIDLSNTLLMTSSVVGATGLHSRPLENEDDEDILDVGLNTGSGVGDDYTYERDESISPLSADDNEPLTYNSSEPEINRLLDSDSDTYGRSSPADQDDGASARPDGSVNDHLRSANGNQSEECDVITNGHDLHGNETYDYETELEIISVSQAMTSSQPATSSVSDDERRTSQPVIDDGSLTSSTPQPTVEVITTILTPVECRDRSNKRVEEVSGIVTLIGKSLNESLVSRSSEDDDAGSPMTWSDDADKNNLMLLLDNERRVNLLRGNTEISEQLQSELNLLQESDVEELENIQVSVKCEISTVLSRFNIRELNQLVIKTNEELMRDNVSQLQSMRGEIELSYRKEIEQLRQTYQAQIVTLMTELSHVKYKCQIECEDRRREIDILKIKHDELMEAEREEKRREIDYLNSKHEELMRIEIERRRLDINDLTTKHIESTVCEVRHEDERLLIDNLEMKHDALIEAEREERRRQIDILNTKHNEIIDAERISIKAMYELTIEELQRKHQEIVEQLESARHIEIAQQLTAQEVSLIKKEEASIWEARFTEAEQLMKSRQLEETQIWEAKLAKAEQMMKARLSEMQTEYENQLIRIRRRHDEVIRQQASLLLNRVSEVSSAAGEKSTNAVVATQTYLPVKCYSSSCTKSSSLNQSTRHVVACCYSPTCQTVKFSDKISQTQSMDCTFDEMSKNTVVQVINEQQLKLKGERQKLMGKYSTVTITPEDSSNQVSSLDSKLANVQNSLESEINALQGATLSAPQRTFTIRQDSVDDEDPADANDDSDSGSDCEHVRMYADLLSKKTDHDEVDEDDDKEELTQQLVDKNSELQRLRATLERLERNLADKDEELKQLRHHYMVELNQQRNSNAYAMLSEMVNTTGLLQTLSTIWLCQKSKMAANNRNLDKMKINELESKIAVLDRKLVYFTTTNDNLTKDGDRLFLMLNSAVKMNSALNDRISEYFQTRHPSVPGTITRWPNSPRPPSSQGYESFSSVWDESILSTMSVISSQSTDDGLDMSRILSGMSDMELNSDSEDFVNDVMERLQRSVDRLLSNASEAFKRLDEMTVRCEQISFELKESVCFNEQLTIKNKELDQESTRLNEERKTLLTQVYQLQQQLDNVDQRSETSLSERRLTLPAVDESTTLVIQQLREQLLDQKQDLEYREQMLTDQATLLANNMEKQQPGLLTDNMQLTIELNDSRKRYDTDRTKFESIQQELEEKIEELDSKLAADETNYRLSTIEFQRRIELLEKQIKSNKDFLEDQTQEREQEREEHTAQVIQLQLKLQEQEREANNKQRIFREELERYNADQLNRIVELEDRIEILQVSESSLVRKNADLHDQLRERRETSDQLLMENYQLETTVKTLQKEAIELKTTKTRLQLALDEMANKEQRYKQRIEELEEELSRQLETIARLSKELSALKDNKQELQQLRLVINQLTMERDKLKNRQSEERSKSKKLLQEMDIKEGQIEELMEDRDLLQRRVDEQLQQIAELKLSMDGLKVTTRDEIDGDVDQLTTYRDVIVVKSEEIDKLKRQIETMQTAMTSTESDAQKLLRKHQQTIYEQDHVIDDLQRQMLENQKSTEAFKEAAAKLQAQLDHTTQRHKQDSDSLRSSFEAITLETERTRQELERSRLAESALRDKIEQIQAAKSVEIEGLKADARADVEQWKKDAAKIRDEYEASKTSAKTETEHLRGEISRLLSQVGASDEVRKLHENQLEILNNEVALLNRRIAHLNDENAELKRVVDAVTARHGELHSAHLKECHRSNELQNLLSAERSRGETLVSKDELSSLTAKLDKELTRSSELQTKLCDEQRKVIELSNELGQMRLTHDILQRGASKHQNKIEALGKELEISREQTATAQCELNKSKSMLDEMCVKVKQLTQHRARISETRTSVGRKELLQLCHQLHLLMIRHQDNLIREFQINRGVPALQTVIGYSTDELIHTIAELQTNLENDTEDEAKTLALIVPELNSRTLQHNSVLTSFTAELMSIRQKLNLRIAQLEKELNTRDVTSPQDRHRLQQLRQRCEELDAHHQSLKFQKKYLLVLIGGFRDNENEVLVELARMGAHPTIASSQRSRCHHPLERFRVATNVVVAIIRLRRGIAGRQSRLAVVYPRIASTPSIPVSQPPPRDDRYIINLSRRTDESTVYHPLGSGADRRRRSMTYDSDVSESRFLPVHNSLGGEYATQYSSAVHLVQSHGEVGRKQKVSSRDTSAECDSVCFRRCATPSPRPMTSMQYRPDDVMRPRRRSLSGASLSSSLGGYHADYLRHIDNLRQASSSTPISHHHLTTDYVF